MFTILNFDHKGYKPTELCCHFLVSLKGRGTKCREETGVGGWERDCRYRRAGCYLGSLIRAQGRVLDNMAAPARCCENTITWPAVQVYYRPTCLSVKLFKHMALFIRLRPLSCQGLTVLKDLYFGYNDNHNISQVSYAKFITNDM